MPTPHFSWSTFLGAITHPLPSEPSIHVVPCGFALWGPVHPSPPSHSSALWGPCSSLTSPLPTVTRISPANLITQDPCLPPFPATSPPSGETLNSSSSHLARPYIAHPLSFQGPMLRVLSCVPSSSSPLPWANAFGCPLLLSSPQPPALPTLFTVCFLVAAFGGPQAPTAGKEPHQPCPWPLRGPLRTSEFLGWGWGACSDLDLTTPTPSPEQCGSWALTIGNDVAQ